MLVRGGGRARLAGRAPCLSPGPLSSKEGGGGKRLEPNEKKKKGLVPESQGHDLAVTVLYVPNSVDCDAGGRGLCFVFGLRFGIRFGIR